MTTKEIHGDPSDEEGDREVWQRRCDVLFEARVQLRYHKRRQRFFDLLDKLTKSATLLLGASLFGKEIPLRPWVIPSCLSAMSLLALVFSYGDRKQLHKELGEQFGVLTADIVEIPPARVTPETVAKWETSLAKQYAKAPLHCAY